LGLGHAAGEREVCQAHAGKNLVHDVLFDDGVLRTVLLHDVVPDDGREQAQVQARIVLGVPVGASAAEIHSRYRQLAHLHHPDHQGGSAQEFMKVRQAFEALTAM